MENNLLEVNNIEVVYNDIIQVLRVDQVERESPARLLVQKGQLVFVRARGRDIDHAVPVEVRGRQRLDLDVAATPLGAPGLTLVDALDGRRFVAAAGRQTFDLAPCETRVLRPASATSDPSS